MQPYLNIIHQELPRLLALYDNDNTRDTYGVGDRYRWAWGLKDFSNGTYQGAVHGLARLVKHDLLPDFISHQSMLGRIDALFSGARYLTRRDGSLEEAFPFEGSYCVTALVAYDLLTAIELLKDQWDQESCLRNIETVRPLISYLVKSNESHAIISNHLATAAAALIKWHQLTGENTDSSGELLLQNVLVNQSDEGWYREYEGADPGYQSLCTYYLADIYRMTSSPELLASLSRSINFLWYFAHPDGSFGGLYGSRNTRFYYPAGLEYLAKDIPQAAALALYMRKSIGNKNVVSLSVMDESNIVPMFNAYCWAAVAAQDHEDSLVIPCAQSQPIFSHWPEGGLIIDGGQDHYTIISTNKGGVVYHFVESKLQQLNAGLLAHNLKGSQISTQAYQKGNNVTVADLSVQVDAPFCPVTRKLPTPFQFVVLRVMNITVMRFVWCREIVKRLLVKLLITGSKNIVGRNKRTIHLGRELKIDDQFELASGYSVEKKPGEFIAIHMASQGYWQSQDDNGDAK